MIPLEVSTWGAKTASGLVSRIFATTSAKGGGAKGEIPVLPAVRAMTTVTSACPMASKIWLQR